MPKKFVTKKKLMFVADLLLADYNLILQMGKDLGFN